MTPELPINYTYRYDEKSESNEQVVYVKEVTDEQSAKVSQFNSSAVTFS
jgi:hypothetical protein